MNRVERDHLSADMRAYAGAYSRGAALILDFLILSLVFFPVTRVVKGVWIMSPAEHQWAYGWFITDPLCLAFLLVICLYFILLEAFFGATLGKSALGLRVVGPDECLPGLCRSIIRNILRVVDSLPAFCILGVILMIRSEQRARFGDRVAGTRVLHVSGRADAGR